MFNFPLRTRQNVASSPTGVSTSLKPASANSSPKGSPNATIGEIDTRAPFQSVKAAVNLFGEASPKSGKPKFICKTVDERVLEKETQLHWTLKELDKYEELLKSAESTKAQAHRDLEKANQSLHELTNKLELISEGKQVAIKSTETAKSRAKELEVLKSTQNQVVVVNDVWKEDVDNERNQYKTSANELISIKQELTSLKQDFDAALEAKLAAFQQAADAQHAAKVNHEKMVQLSKEVDNMLETLHRVKLASEKAHEEHANLIEEKEARLESTKKAKEDLDLKIESLKKEHEISQLRILGQKLEEKNEAINVLEEQLREVRVADMETLEKAKLEVDEEKKRLEEIEEEEASLRSVVETLKQDLEKVKRDITLLRGDSLKREKQQLEFDKIKLEIEVATTELTKATNSIKELELKIKETMSEAEKAKKEEEDVKKEEETLRKQASQSENTNKEAEEQLEVSLRELEKAKAAEELASDQIRKRTSQSAMDDNNKIRLTVQEYEALKKKGEEAGKEADSKVATAMSQVETIKKKERQTIKKLEKSMEDIKDVEVELSDALKMAEMAEAAKEAIESELKKWRSE